MITINYAIDAAKYDSALSRWHELVTAASKNSITLEKNGHFTGNATGDVRIGKSMIVIEISKKPFIVPEFAIRQKLTKMLDEFFS